MAAEVAVDLRVAWRGVQAAHRAVHAGAGELTGALADLVRNGWWQEYEHPLQGVRHYERFADFVTEELNLTPTAVVTLLRESNRRSSADEVERLLRQEVEPVAEHGEVGRGRVRESDTHSKRRDATAVLARLKRDDPALAAQVVAGQITPNAAAIAAGIRHRYARVRTDNARQAVAVLLRHYSADTIRAALEDA